MKGLVMSVMAVSLCLGSSLALASHHKMMWVQTENGDKVKILVPKSQAHKIDRTPVKLYELRGQVPLAHESNLGRY